MMLKQRMRCFTSRRLKTDAALLVNEQATVDNIRKAVVSAARKVHENGTLLLAFSGHGVPINTSSDHWEAAFLTYEFRSFSEISPDPDKVSLQGAFTLQDVKRWLNKAEVVEGNKDQVGIKPPNIVVIMDSCGSGAGTHGGIGEDNVNIDGRRAVARQFDSAKDIDVLEQHGVTQAGNVELANSQSDWPPGSAVFAVSAATGGGVVHEIPQIGHGVLSMLVLEWFRKVFLAQPKGVADLGSGAG